MATHDLAILSDVLKTLLVRDLNGLDREIAAYPDDESLWLTPPGISNSGGNLALHLMGNLRHFIGSVYGRTGYVRDRDSEFARRSGTRAEIRNEIQTTIQEIEAGLSQITAEQLESVYPLPLRDFRVRAAEFVTHLAVHFGYHLGQIDYHRRMLTPNPTSADTVAIGALSISSS